MADRRAPGPAPAATGFTLLEMMVALAVFSLAALALIRLEGAVMRGTATLDETILAQVVARNVAIDALSDARPPAFGKAEGTEENGGRAWHWTRQAAALGDQGAVRIDIVVTDRAGVSRGRLTVVRPPDPPAAPATVP